MAWVTSGYTIENYVPEQILGEAIRVAHPSTRGREFPPQKQWQNPLAPDRLGIKKPSKVAVAKAATRVWGDTWPLDLKRQVRKTISLIHAANSHT